jgi:hypothetical protein
LRLEELDIAVGADVSAAVDCVYSVSLDEDQPWELYQGEAL